MDTVNKFAVTFGESGNNVYIKLSDSLSTEGIKTVFEQVINAAEYRPGMPGIYDVTHADLSEIDGESIEELSLQIEKLAKGKTGTAKVALVSENDINFCTLQLFKEIYQDDHTELEIFESLRKAEEWILTRIKQQ